MKSKRLAYLPGKTITRDMTDRVILIKLEDHREEWQSRFGLSPETTPLADGVRNYETVTESIECPVLLETVAVDQAIIATCCWNGFSADVFLEMYRAGDGVPCPLCRGQMLQHYVTLQTYNVFLPARKRIGVSLEWPVSVLFDVIEREMKGRIVKLYNPHGARILHGEARSVKQTGFRSGSLVRVWFAADDDEFLFMNPGEFEHETDKNKRLASLSWSWSWRVWCEWQSKQLTKYTEGLLKSAPVKFDCIRGHRSSQSKRTIYEMIAHDMALAKFNVQNLNNCIDVEEAMEQIASRKVKILQWTPLL
jgi:hypothetical protein